MTTPGTRAAAVAGFTLVEVMIAAAILGFVILGLGTFYAFTTRTTTYARRANAASTIARNAIEEARNTAYANLPTLHTDPAAAPPRPPVCFDKELARLASCAGGSTVFTRTTSIAAETPIAGLTEIRVVVTWPDEKGRQRRSELASSISRY